MIFPTDPLRLPRHPSQLYEALLEGALVIAVMLPLFWKTRARYRPGLLVGVFTVLIASARFIVEFFRAKDDRVVFGALTYAQMISVAFVVFGIAWMAWRWRPRPGAPGIYAAELTGSQVIVVSNREPYIHNRGADGRVALQRPASGMVTALEPIMRACGGTWIAHGSGTADRDASDKHDRVAVGERGQTEATPSQGVQRRVDLREWTQLFVSVQQPLPQRR
jgi:hypothetical protein